MILKMCDSPHMMEVLRIVNLVINILKIVIPIMLIVSVMIDYFKEATHGEGLDKTNKLFVNKIIAAVLIFLVPTLISIIVNVVGGNTEYKDCLIPHTREEINAIYVEKENELVSKAESTLEVNDYNVAKSYLSNIKDLSTKKAFTDRLAEVEKNLKHPNVPTGNNSGGSHGGGGFNVGGGGSYPPTTYGSMVCEGRSTKSMGYGLCVPKEYKNESIPLIVWLHGGGEVGQSYSYVIQTGLLAVITNWSSTGLKDIPAIIVAPLLSSGEWGDASSQVRDVIMDVENNYNINKKKISLIGHSHGGTGVVYVANNNQDLFSSLVILSGYTSSVPSGSENYFKNIPMIGYAEEGEAYNLTYSLFDSVGKKDNLYKFYCHHGQVPREAIEVDNNQDKVSDLVYWMLSW